MRRIMMSAYPFVSNQTLITSRMARSMSFLGLLMLLCMTAYSQQPETGEPVDRRTIQELLDRIASLEASDKQLRDRVAQLEKAQPGSASPAPALTQSPGPAPTFTAPALADNSSRQPAVAKADPQPTPQAEQSSMPEPDHMDVSKTAEHSWVRRFWTVWRKSKGANHIVQHRADEPLYHLRPFRAFQVSYRVGFRSASGQ